MVLNPELSDENLSATLEKVSKLVAERGGNVTEVNQWGTRRLAYPIKHFLEGKYVLTYLTFEPALAAELESNLQIWEEVLRYLLVRLND